LEITLRIDKLMARPVQCFRPEDTLAHAAQLMWDYDCGWLPVSSGNGAMRVTGAITDRDACMCALFQNKPLSELRVAQAMASEVKVGHPSDSLAQAEQIMRAARIRRLPVVDEPGSLVGMISLADLAQEAARERGAQRRAITEKKVGDTLAAICEPAGRQLAA
jgi:CBS domain-containing protein